MKRQKLYHGHTLVEILVAMALFMVVMTIAYGALQLIMRTRMMQEAHADQRRIVRAAAQQLTAELRQATHVYQGFTGTVMGTVFNVPNAGSGGSSLMVAVPKDATGSLFNVVAAYTEPRKFTDADNPDAQDVVIRRFSVIPGLLGDVTSINLLNLLGGTQRRYDTYLDPAVYAAPSLRRPFTLSQPASSIFLDLQFRRKTKAGTVSAERYTTQITMRNITL